jgi:hyperosmotically inducible periplasmic protein
MFSFKRLPHVSRMAALFVVLMMPFASRSQDSSKPAMPDNTKANREDRKKAAITADQQKMNMSDREITRKIRRALVADDSLSTYAHNVKIITRDGLVTLRGPVRSAEEKQLVEAKAAEVAGGTEKVASQISIANK